MSAPFVYIVTMKKLTSFFILITTAVNLFWAQQALPAITIAQNSINSFDTKLYEALSSQEGNVNFSAISIYSLLYALQKGAKGQTQEQINRVIDLEPSQEADIQLQNIITNTQNMTNSLWYKKTLTIQNDYNNFIKDYDFILKPSDFYNGPKTRKDINSFISEKTDKLIENFLQEDLPSSTQLVLLNTLYFNQKWETEFDEENTRDQTFYKTKDNQIKVPMMHKTTSMPYYEDDNFQIIELYYQDKRYSMLVALPKNYEYDFSLTNPNNLIEKYNAYKSRQRVQLSFPKFDLTSKYDLIPLLQNLGMIDAFNPFTADFTDIFIDSQNIYVDAAIHQVRIQVNEKETKAAAVTMFSMKATSAMPQHPPIVFTADHPFIYVIRDNETGINLFTGIVRQPK